MLSRTAAVAIVGLLSLIWGTTWAVIRIGLEGVPPFAGVALRFAVAAVLLLGLGLALGVRFGTSRREVVLWLVNGLFSFVLSYGLVYWAEQRVPSALAAVIFATFPLFVALLAHWYLPGERLTGASVAGVLVGFVGVVLIFSEDLDQLTGHGADPGGGAAHALPGAALGADIGVAGAAGLLLLAPAFAAVGSVAVKRWGKGIHPISLAAVPMGLTALVMGAASWLFERGATFTFDRVSVGAILYLAVVGSALGFSLYFWVLERMAATRLSLITYLSPVVAVAIGTLVLGETLTLRILGGVALVILGVAVTLRGKQAPAQGTQATAGEAR